VLPAPPVQIVLRRLSFAAKVLMRKRTLCFNPTPKSHAVSKIPTQGMLFPACRHILPSFVRGLQVAEINMALD
jgi:hypothetical protein